MEEMTLFFQIYGWQLALIALLGIVLLGVLKYANAFSKIDKDKRKPIYFAISIGFSLCATIIYLLIIDKFTVEFFITVATAIYALNQTMYSIYETTKPRDLVAIVLTFVKNRKIKTEDKEE